MAFLRALIDATPLGVLVALGAFVVARVSGTLPLPPAVVGVVAGLAVLAGGTGVSRRFQTEERRYPMTWVALELLALP
jgi:uncharacterized membrane protein YbhN (UPF0104 family)